MKELGKFLFKYRDKTGIPFFIIMLFFSRPSLKTFLISFPFLITGELMRVFSLMYTGESTRAKDLNAPFLATGGPYAYVRNPIYLGNFLIALSVIIFYNPPFIFYPLFVILFFFQYTVIVLEEERFLEKEFGEEYLTYKKHVRRFLPCFKPYHKRSKKIYKFLEVFKFEKSTIFLILFLITFGFILSFIR